MILSAHQPLFLPWLGFFDKIRRANVFVMIDHVQYEKQDYQNRNKILTRAGPQLLVVPVKHGSHLASIAEKEISYPPGTPWGEKLAATIKHAYAKAPHASRYLPFLEDALTRPWTHLVDLDCHLIDFFLSELEITTPVIRSTTLPRIEGLKTEMILNLCRAVDANVYLSGAGGSREYLDTALLLKNGVEPRWQEFNHPVYPQGPTREGVFVPNLSVVDLLMNCGPASAAVLRGETAAPVEARPIDRRRVG